MPDTTRTQFSIGAFAIIFDDAGRVLLSHRCDRDVWNLPGGGMEVGELPDEAVIREVREETGLEVRVERLVGVYAKPHSTDLVFSFVCRVVGGVMGISSEADANAYFAIDQLPANTLLRHAERIWDALDLPRAAQPCQPVFKRHSPVRR